MISIIGGILMILGAWSIYIGNVKQSIIFYVLADLMWLFLSIQSGQIFGSVVVAIALVFIIFTAIKMHTGMFHSHITKDR